MQNCYQSENETIWQHCQNVSMTYFKLLEAPDLFPLPDFIKENFELIKENQLDQNIVRDYLEWHDCGKPFCRVEENGKIKFPGHAKVSRELFIQAGGSLESAELIGLDMLFHTSSAKSLLELQLDKKTMYTLMLSAWASLFSNAQMFGGFGSENYKIKRSQMLARCKCYINAKYEI